MKDLLKINFGLFDREKFIFVKYYLKSQQLKTEAIFDNIAKRIEEQINLAEDKIFIAVAWFTNKNLFQALCKKASEGVKVKLVISDNEINRNSTINHSDIQIGKSKLYWIETHNKFCIIDDYIVITGSYNWSYKAENNLENIIICSGDNDLVKQFKKELKRIIKDYPQEDAIHPLLKRTEAEKYGNVKPYIPSSKFNEYGTLPAIPSIKNDFESIKIGEQEWMVKNLDVDRFRNGDLIPHIKSNIEWQEARVNKQPAWCYYLNDPANESVYGKIYNWFAVNDERGLAPVRWHVSNNEDWRILIEYLGGMKETYGHFPIRWNIQNTVKAKESGFNTMLGGYRNDDGSFGTIGNNAFFWSATEFMPRRACDFSVKDSGNYVEKNVVLKSLGLSVRCLKD